MKFQVVSHNKINEILAKRKMDNIKKAKKISIGKETRWDRISKKHINSVNVTTENVKKFFGMTFVNENQLKLMNGEELKTSCIDPMLVMNMRHEIVYVINHIIKSIE